MRVKSLPLKILSSLPLGVRMLPVSFCHDSTLEREILRHCAKFCSEIHDPALFFRVVRDFFFLQMHLRGEITRNYHVLITSLNTRGIMSHRLKTISTVQTFCLALIEEQDIEIDCNGSSLPLFSIPCDLRVANIVAQIS